MKLVHFLLVVLAAINLHARADFLITQAVESPGQPGQPGQPGKNREIAMKIKGDLIRVEATPEVSMIMNNSTGDMITLMHSQKAYTKINAEAMKAMMEQMKKMTAQAGASPAAKPQFVKTGRSEKINGYDADEYTLSIMGSTQHYWVTKSYPNAAKLMQVMEAMQKSSMASLAKDMMPDFKSLNGIVIKTESEMMGNKTVSTLKSVTEQDLSASDFEIPSGYTEMKMPQMQSLPGK